MDCSLGDEYSVYLQSGENHENAKNPYHTICLVETLSKTDLFITYEEFVCFIWVGGWLPPIQITNFLVRYLYLCVKACLCALIEYPPMCLSFVAPLIYTLISGLHKTALTVMTVMTTMTVMILWLWQIVHTDWMSFNWKIIIMRRQQVTQHDVSTYQQFLVWLCSALV